MLTHSTLKGGSASVLAHATYSVTSKTVDLGHNNTVDLGHDNLVDLSHDDTVDMGHDNL